MYEIYCLVLFSICIHGAALFRQSNKFNCIVAVWSICFSFNTFLYVLSLSRTINSSCFSAFCPLKDTELWLLQPRGGHMVLILKHGQPESFPAWSYLLSLVSWFIPSFLCIFLQSLHSIMILTRLNFGKLFCLFLPIARSRWPVGNTQHYGDSIKWVYRCDAGAELCHFLCNVHMLPQKWEAPGHNTVPQYTFQVFPNIPSLCLSS